MEDNKVCGIFNNSTPVERNGGNLALSFFVVVLLLSEMSRSFGGHSARVSGDGLATFKALLKKQKRTLNLK